MKTNQLDNKIKEKFDNRTLKPSASAWERLSAQLNEQPQKKNRGWFFYFGYAASILLLISIGIKLLSSDEKIIPKNEIVLEKIELENFDKKLKEFKTEIPVEKGIVTLEKSKEKSAHTEIAKLKDVKPKKKKTILVTENKVLPNKKITIVKALEKKPLIVALKNKKNTFFEKSKSSININPNDLLYAVTHSQNQVEAYYAKHNVTKEDVLNTIKSELKKSNLKVNPNVILAEVENKIATDNYENNFLKNVKKKVSNIATAIASRND